MKVSIEGLIFFSDQCIFYFLVVIVFLFQFRGSCFTI